MPRMEIVIPLPMPTWNRILAMHHWERAKLREYLHAAVSMSITYGADWPTQMVFRSRRYSTDLFRLEYLAMIRPNKSRKSAIAKLKVRTNKRSS